MSFLDRVLHGLVGPSVVRARDLSLLNDPNLPLSAAATITSGYANKAGVPISERSSLQLSGVWRAVNLVSRDVAKLPFGIYRRIRKDGKVVGREPDEDHPSYRLINERPNGWYGAFVFRQTIQVHVLLWGNGYAAIERGPAGEAIALYILDPETTFPVIYQGQLWYVTGHGTAHERKLDPSMVLHIRGLGFDGLVGKSVIQCAAESLGLAVATRDFGSVHFRNASVPRIVLTHPGQLSPEAAKRLAVRFDTVHAGIDHAFKTAVLAEGMKAEAFSVSASDAQLIEGRAFQLREIAGWFNVPPHKIGDDSRTAFASLEEENQSYIDEGVDPWLVVWEQEVDEKLRTERQKSGRTHYSRFTRQAMARANMEARSAYYASGIQNGYLSPDEVRALEDQNPIPGGLGAVYYRPKNVDVVGEDQPDPEAPDDDPAPTDDPTEPDDVEDEVEENATIIEAVRAVAADAVGRAVRRLYGDGQKAAGRPKRFLDEVDCAAFSAAHLEAVRAILEPVAHLSRTFELVEIDAGAVAAELIGQVARELLEAAGRSKAGELGSVVEQLTRDRVGPTIETTIDSFVLRKA